MHLHIEHLFLCRKCAHNMLPLQSLQYGRNFPCSQVRRLGFANLSGCCIAPLVDGDVEDENGLDGLLICCNTLCITLMIWIARGFPAIRCPCVEEPAAAARLCLWQCRCVEVPAAAARLCYTISIPKIYGRKCACIRGNLTPRKYTDLMFP